MTRAAKQIWFHAGVHKTGTSTLQFCLRKNASRLPDGAAYFDHRHPTLQPLVHACKQYQRRRTDQNLGLIRSSAEQVISSDDFQDADTILLSSEALLGRIPSDRDDAMPYHTAPQVADAMRTGFGVADMKVLLFTREMRGWVRSLYKHLVRTRGMRLTQQAFENLSKFQNFSWAKMLADLSAVQNVSVIERDAADARGLRLGPAEIFLITALGDRVDLATFETAEVRNVGMPDWVLEKVSTPFWLNRSKQVRRMYIKWLLRRAHNAPKVAA